MLGNSWTNRTKLIHLHRKKGTQFGFSIRGGKEHGVGIFVSHVEPGSEAEQQNLQVGDEITRINGCSLAHCIHKEVLNLIRMHNHVTLHVKNVGAIPVKDLSVDVGLIDQTSSPPLLSPSHRDEPLTWKYVNNNNIRGNSVSTPSPNSNSFSVMRISIDMSGHVGLGCSICKGPKEKPGIFVQSTKINGLAQNVGLQVGDQIVEVNGLDVSHFDFQDVVSHLKSNQKLELVVKKGAGIDLFPVESSGYNSSTSSLHEENLHEEKLGIPKINHEINDRRTSPSPIEETAVERLESVEKVEEIEETEETEETETKTETEIETVINNMESDEPEITFIKERMVSETVKHVTRVITTVDVHHNDMLEDENDVVEGIRKVAEEEIRRDARTQTAGATTKNEEDVKEPCKMGEKWRRTLIADVIDGDKGFPVPPPLPMDDPVRIEEEEYESMTETEKKTEIKHTSKSKNSRTFPSKAAEEIQKRQQHDMLIEEFKRVRKLMFVPEENAPILPPPQGWETKPDAKEVDTKLTKSVSLPETNQFPKITPEQKTKTAEILYIDINQPEGANSSRNFSTQNPNPKSITDSRYQIPQPPKFFFSQSKLKPNVTIGTYQTKNQPNKLGFLQSGVNGNQHERNGQVISQPNQNGHQNGQKHQKPEVVTVIHNGPTKSTAFIHTNGSKSDQGAELSQFSNIVNFEKNKVKIQVKGDSGNKWDRKRNDEFPIILEELPKNTGILVEDFNPLKLFTEKQIAGRQMKMFSIPKGNAMDILIEGGFGSPLGGRIIVSKIREGSEIYKHNVISKGDQIMWINGCSTIDITLSQAQGIIREAAKRLNEPLKIIVAKAPIGIYDDV